MIKARLPIEFLNVGVTNPLITQMLLSDNFFMNTKFVDLIELYKLGFHKKIVTQKQLGDQGVCHTDIEKFNWRTHFKCWCAMCLPLKLYSLDDLTKNKQQQKEKFQEKMEEKVNLPTIYSRQGIKQRH